MSLDFDHYMILFGSKDNQIERNDDSATVRIAAERVTSVLSRLLDATAPSQSSLAYKFPSVMAELETIIERHLKKRAVGEFALPGLLKIKTVKKPAQRAKKGVPNPFKPGDNVLLPTAAFLAILLNKLP